MSVEQLIDARDLEPPEPFVRVMEALELLDLGHCSALRLLINREPFPLYRVLEQNGYRWEGGQQADGSFVVRILPKMPAA